MMNEPYNVQHLCSIPGCWRTAENVVHKTRSPNKGPFGYYVWDGHEFEFVEEKVIYSHKFGPCMPGVTYPED